MCIETGGSGKWILLMVGILSSCGPSGAAESAGGLRGPVGSISQPLSFPLITGVSPPYGSPIGGYVLTISGTNFIGTSCDLNFGGTHIPVTPSGGVSVSLMVPSLPTGALARSVSIQVTCSGLPSNVANFVYLEDRVTLLPPLTAKGSEGQHDFAVADFDGDGQNDVVIANPLSSGLTIYRGLGGGRLDPVRDSVVTLQLVVANGPYAVAVGDLDKDGWMDIAVTQLRAGNVTILWNNTAAAGTLSFSSDTRPIAAAATSDPKSLVIADVDGDGWNDLVVSHPATSSLSFLGVTSSRSVAGYTTLLDVKGAPASWTVESLFAADLDGNGASELITLGNGGTLLTILPDGKRWTDAWQYISFPAEYRSLAISDLVGDKSHEILLGAAADSYVLILTVDRGGTLLSSVPNRFNTSGLVQSLDIADIDGDTHPDVVVGLTAAAAFSLDVLLGDPKSLLKPAQPADLGSRGGLLRLADMTRDGRPDAVVLDGSIPILSNGQNLITVRRNLKTGFEPMWLMDSGGPQPFVLTHLDANGDSHVDIALADSSAKALQTFIGHGDGTLSSTAKPTPLSAAPGCLAAGDFNGDFRDDLLVCRSEPLSRGIDMWPAEIDGTFSHSIRQIGAAAMPLVIAKDAAGIGLDGNSFPDFVVGGALATNTLLTLVGKPPAMLDFTGHPYQVGKAVASVVIANFRGTNQDVLAAAPQENAIFLLAGNGMGKLATARQVATVSAPDLLAVADFDGDYQNDFIALSSSQGKLSLFLGNGAGAFSLAVGSEVDFGTTSAPSALVVGDFNQDHVPDLAVRLDGPMRIKILLGTGNGQFIASPTEILTDSGGAMDIVDLDHDGSPDLVVSGSKNVAGVMTGWVTTLLTGRP